MYISVFNEKHYLLVSAFSLRSYIPARHKQSKLKSWSCGGFKNLVCHWIWWECSKDHPLGLFEALADRDCSGQNHYSTYSTCSNVMNFSLALSLSLSLCLSLSLAIVQFRTGFYSRHASSITIEANANLQNLGISSSGLSNGLVHFNRNSTWQSVSGTPFAW